MIIETKFTVNHWEDTDKVIGKIGVSYDTSLYEDVAYLEFQKGHWDLSKAHFVKSSDGYVFVELDEEKIDELIKTLELIKEQIN